MADLRWCIRHQSVLATLLAVALLAAAGCNRSDAKKAKKSDTAADAPPARPAVLPQYRFTDPTLETKFPDAVAFVREFLESCLAGDYDAYRKLVSRYEDPQRREQFDKLATNLKRIEVESIAELDPAELRKVPHPIGVDLSPPAYLVISAIEFANPDAGVALRYRNRKLALLIFREEGEWRMRPAPPKMQPRDPHAGDEQHADDKPAEPVPDYPWDRGGDG